VTPDPSIQVPTKIDFAVLVKEEVKGGPTALKVEGIAAALRDYSTPHEA
jgi:hypothetical protein